MDYQYKENSRTCLFNQLFIKTLGYQLSAQVYCREHSDVPLIEDYHAGDMICSLCGLVVGDRVIDVSSEWRTFMSDKNCKDQSRVGCAENPLLDINDMSTMLATSSDNCRDEFGKPLYRDRRMIPSSDRTLFCAFREISQMADRLNLPKILVDQANVLYKKVHDSKTLRNHSCDAVGAACLYIACRQDYVPRTLKEICAVTKISKKGIGRVFKLILKKLNTNVRLITTEDFMSRFCSNLGLSSTIQKTARYIASKAVELDLVPGRNPVSVTAAAIYMASQTSGNKKTAKEIGEIAGVAEVTLLQSYKLMLPRTGDLMPTKC